MIISQKKFDEERALYNLKDAVVEECVFDGPADGESALKESCNIEVNKCDFRLRYPLWHAKHFTLKDSSMNDKARAAVWYAQDGTIQACALGGIKAVRECRDIRINSCAIQSPEFGWKCDGLEISATALISEYPFFDSRNIRIANLDMKGKYSFQYVENMTITNSVLDTKDAFWHSNNVTVRDSVIKGEYLAWYSRNLRLINCKIIGTQPLCYCDNLVLENCTMEDTDLSFEYSSVEATVKGNIVSVKNPKAGHIKADSIGEIILQDSIMESECVIETDD